MNEKNFGLRAAGTVFGVVGLVHLTRLVAPFGLTVAGYFIPLWINGVGLVLAGGLAIWLFRLAAK